MSSTLSRCLSGAFLICFFSAPTWGQADLIDRLNLGFEAGDEPRGWFAGGEGYQATIDAENAHSGERCMRLRHEEGGRFATVTGEFPVAEARGKQLRLAGYLRTEDVTDGYAGLWMRVDGPEGMLEFDNMRQRGVLGTTPWTRYEILLDVPDEAVNILFGALLTGHGTVWVDDFLFETLKPEPVIEVAVRGVVRDEAGGTVAGAEVALVPAVGGEAEALARSDAEGRFELVGEAGAEYALTATAEGFTAAYQKPRVFPPGDSADEQILTVGGEGWVLSGEVLDELERPVPGVTLRLVRISDDRGDLF